MERENWETQSQKGVVQFTRVQLIEVSKKTTCHRRDVTVTKDWQSSRRNEEGIFKRQAWAVGKIWNNERDYETYNESDKKSDGQRHHMDFAETMSVGLWDKTGKVQKILKFKRLMKKH